MTAREISRTTSARGELVLLERGDPAVLELRANGLFVMDSAETSSEQQLATAALAATAAPREVLVGGLGLGFTLRAVLADARVRRCTVVELEPDLVSWLRDGLVPGGPELLGDDRVEVVVADVGSEIARARDSTYDLVLLDVDNGPGNLVHQANAALYATGSLHHVRRILRRGGAAVVWSAAESPDLAHAMDSVFDEVEVSALPVDLQGREERYWLYTGRIESGLDPHAT